MMRPVLAALLTVMPAVALSAQQHLLEGNPKSPVRVVIYEDLQCPDCAVFRKMLDEKLLPKYGQRVAFEHRDFPLAKHAWARPAAIASRYFETVRPALASEWRSTVMGAQASITAQTFPAYLKSFAAKHDVPEDKVMAALEDPTLQKLVQKDFDEGTARGIAHTPTALVNGRPFIETFTVEEISQGIDEALKEEGVQ